MAIEYAKSALSESIIPVKDVPLKVTSGTGIKPVTYVSAPIGDLVQISGGVVDAVTLTNNIVATTVTNLGVSEGMNFEGLGVTPKTGKVRFSANAIYKAPYGTVASGGGFTPVEPTQALVGSQRAIGKATDEGFVVHTATTGVTNLVKIVEIDAQDKVVYFQLIPSALFTS